MIAPIQGVNDGAPVPPCTVSVTPPPCPPSVIVGVAVGRMVNEPVAADVEVVDAGVVVVAFVEVVVVVVEVEVLAEHAVMLESGVFVRYVIFSLEK